MLKIPLLRSLSILAKKERMSSCSMCYPICFFAVCVPGWILQVSALVCIVCPAMGKCSSHLSGWAMQLQLCDVMWKCVWLLMVFGEREKASTGSPPVNMCLLLGSYANNFLMQSGTWDTGLLSPLDPSNIWDACIWARGRLINWHQYISSCKEPVPSQKWRSHQLQSC